LFNAWRRDVNIQVLSGFSSVITEVLYDEVDAHVPKNRQFTVEELQDAFRCVPRALVYEILAVKLRYRNSCATWIPECFEKIVIIKTKKCGLYKIFINSLT
jgi:hypothetical protein